MTVDLNKYQVTKTDGETDPEAVYFPLRIDSDPSARVALRCYARTVGFWNQRLAESVLELLASTPLAHPPEGWEVIPEGTTDEEWFELTNLDAASRRIASKLHDMGVVYDKAVEPRDDRRCLMKINFTGTHGQLEWGVSVVHAALLKTGMTFHFGYSKKPLVEGAPSEGGAELFGSVEELFEAFLARVESEGA